MIPNPCFSCETLCCDRFTIYVNYAEVLRLARSLEAEPASLVRLETRTLSPSLPVVRIDGVEGQLALKVNPESGGCGFLDRETARCTVHDVAPYTCRMYPHRVSGGKRLEAPRLRDDALCPGAFALDEAQARDLSRLARRFWHRELPAYERRVWVWNRLAREGDLAAFLAFCRQQLVIDKRLASPRFLLES